MSIHTDDRHTADKPPAPSAPPRWRGWLLLAGAVLTVVLFLLPSRHAAGTEQ